MRLGGRSKGGTSSQHEVLVDILLVLFRFFSQHMALLLIITSCVYAGING